MKLYPFVMDEFATLDVLSMGFSIARFGDGEFKMADNKAYIREAANNELAWELRQILQEPHANCIVGIPTMTKHGPKFQSWVRHIERFAKMLSEDVQYYSSFISRPDSAPWIDNMDFAKKFQSLWAGKKAVVLCEGKGSAARLIHQTAAHMTTIRCPHEGSYKHIDKWETKIVALKPDIAVLSCGPTATCLAHRLATHGIQAIDFGSGGSFLMRLLNE